MREHFNFPERYRPFLDERNKRILEMISPEKNKKILIIGTGIYPKIEYFLFNNYGCRDIISLDIDKANLSRASKILPALKFMFADAQRRLPFRDNLFDVVVMTEVLEHLRNEGIALSEIYRILKKDGILALSVPKRRWFNIFSPITHIQHVREYDEDSITGVLVKNNFQVERIFVGGTFFEIINLWIHLILKYSIRYVSPDIFFKNIINKSYKKDFRGKGFDIILRARPIVTNLKD